jgi:hypothetical protein
VVNRLRTIGAILLASPSSIITGKITEESAQAIAGVPIRQAIAGERIRPQMITYPKIIGVIGRARLEIEPQKKGRPQMFTRQSDIRAIAQIIRQDKMFAGEIKISEMRSKSAEVLLFLNFVHLTTSWVPRPMGWP